MLFPTLLSALLLGQSVASPLLRSTSNSSTPSVLVRNGTISGLHSTEYNQDFFLGIPYAQPPVGPLRFANPESLNTSFTKYDATQFSNECVGYGSDQWNYETSEDCLYLNIIRPSGYEKEKLPVIFWIHGGGFSEGGAPDQRYNQSFMVQNSVDIGKPIIAVSTNYRLSAWGFLSSQELTGEGDTNMGLRDQRLALHWVQENIASFGGDQQKVTIQGESAGGASVGFHLTAFGGRDDKLFRAAIMQSGNPIAYGAFNGSIHNQPLYDDIVSGVNCSQALDTLACLRATPFETLNGYINGTNSTLPTAFDPIVDGDFIQRYGSLQLEAGQFVHVPIIDGANSDEGTAFSKQGINTTEDLHNAISSSYVLASSFTDELINAYPDEEGFLVPLELPADYQPGPPYGAQFRRSAAIAGDIVFIAARRQTVTTWAQFGVPAYSYRFNAIPAGISQDIGVTHFQEVAFVFYNLAGVGYLPAAEPPFTGKPASYAQLSKEMDSSWISFVHDLNPNTWRGSNSSGDQWPVYSISDPQNFVWDANRTSYAEPDTWRAAGISLINENAAGVFAR